MSRDAEIRTQLARQRAKVELSGEIQWEEEADQAKAALVRLFLEQMASASSR